MWHQHMLSASDGGKPQIRKHTSGGHLRPWPSRAHGSSSSTGVTPRCASKTALRRLVWSHGENLSQAINLAYRAGRARGMRDKHASVVRQGEGGRRTGGKEERHRHRVGAADSSFLHRHAETAEVRTDRAHEADQHKRDKGAARGALHLGTRAGWGGPTGAALLYASRAYQRIGRLPAAKSIAEYTDYHCFLQFFY